MRMLLAIPVLLCIAGPIQAQTLPDKPKANNAEFWTYTAAMATGWTLDTISTQQTFSRCPTCKENGGLFNDSRNVPKIMAAWAGIDVGAAILSYQWKKRVHNKWLHPLWRLPLIYRSTIHTQSAFHNWRQ